MTETLVSKLVRENVKKLIPYKSARGTTQNNKDLLCMDAAENPWSPIEGTELNRYPSPQPIELLSAIGELYNTNPSNILITRGSEESIRLLIQTFCTPNKDKIITCPPTFAMYKTEAEINETENILIPRIGEFANDLNIDAIKDKIDNTNHIKMIFICSPGNPSSTAIPSSTIDILLEYTKEKCLVVIDEAYIDFAKHSSFVNKLNEYQNLIVLRTFSKSYGLAGLRIGCTIASEEIISYMQRAMLPYPIPRPTIDITLKILTGDALSYMKEKQKILKQEREYMKEQLSSFGNIEKLYPSDSNFLCIIVKNAQNFVDHFKRYNVSIRNRSSAIENSVNIAVGTREQNNLILDIIKEYKNES